MCKDIFGREIKAGDFVVYGIRSGNSGGMRYGIVEEPDTKYNDAWGTGERRVKVITFRNYSLKGNFAISRPSPENMIIVHDDTFPQDIAKKLWGQYSASIAA